MDRELDHNDYQQIAGAWIHPQAEIGRDVLIEPGAVIGAEARIGDGCRIGAGAVVYGPTVLGARNTVWATAVLGGAPQDLGYAGEPTRLEIGDDNIFREGVTINRGTVKGGGVTRIGSRNLFMAGCHVGHDCRVEDHVVLTNDALIAGHCHIQSNVYMAGRVAVVQFTTVGRYAFLTGLSGTTMDVEPFISHTGVPARPRAVNIVALRRAGYPNATIKSLMEAYKVLFTSSSKGGEDLGGIRDELDERGVLCDEVLELLDFIRRSRAGKHGRMLQGDEGLIDEAPSGYAVRWQTAKAGSSKARDDSDDEPGA